MCPNILDDNGLIWLYVAIIVYWSKRIILVFDNNNSNKTILIWRLQECHILRIHNHDIPELTIYLKSN